VVALQRDFTRKNTNRNRGRIEPSTAPGSVFQQLSDRRPLFQVGTSQLIAAHFSFPGSRRTRRWV
jgi:hypothetical protein